MKTRKQNDYKSINIDPNKENICHKVQVEDLRLNFSLKIFVISISKRKHL